jgi:cardiolipin synthase (CMP-forming)
MNIPNALTIIRIIFVPIIIILLIQGSFFKALILFTLSGITDVLDGALARFLNQQTTLGASLDPIADKALMMSCFVTLSIKHAIPGWLTVIVISRDCIILIGISVLALMSVAYEIRPSVISKITTLLQILTIFFVLAIKSFSISYGQGWLLPVSFGLTTLFTVISGLHYLFRGIRLMNQAS